MGTKLSELLTTFKRQAEADRTKAGVLGALFLVLLVLGGRALFFGSKPATANAAPTPPALTPVVPPDPVQPAVRPSMENSAAGLVAATQALLSQTLSQAAPAPAPAAPQAGPATARVCVGDMSRVLERDLFSSPSWARLSVAEVNATDEGEASNTMGSDGFWMRLGAALRQIPEARRADLERLNAELKQLALQSTMTGPTPIAYISGRLVREGDELNGFSILRIKDRRVVVRKYGLTRTLKMP